MSTPADRSYATSTPSGDSVSGLHAVISKTNGKLHQLWLDLTEAFTWTGEHTYNSGGTATTTFNRGVDIDADANTPLILNTQEYVFQANKPNGSC
jgi:hypothetical protein